MIKCSLCGFIINEKNAEESCKGCVLKGCGMVKCPNCGFELAPDPEWIKKLKEKRGKKNDANR